MLHEELACREWHTNNAATAHERGTACSEADDSLQDPKPHRLESGSRRGCDGYRFLVRHHKEGKTLSCYIYLISTSCSADIIIVFPSKHKHKKQANLSLFFNEVCRSRCIDSSH